MNQAVQYAGRWRPTASAIQQSEASGHGPNEPTFRRHAMRQVGWFKNAGYRRFSDDNSASTAVRGNVRPPHDYGIAVILLGVADRLVPSDQVEALRDVVSRFLRASYVD